MKKDYFERERESFRTRIHTKARILRTQKTRRRRRTTATIMKSNKHEDDK